MALGRRTIEARKPLHFEVLGRRGENLATTSLAQSLRGEYEVLILSPNPAHIDFSSSPLNLERYPDFSLLYTIFYNTVSEHCTMHYLCPTSRESIFIPLNLATTICQ